MSSKNRLDVFITHSSLDEDFVSKLKCVLERYLGFNVFISEDNIEINEEWELKIINELKKSKLVIPIISENIKKAQFANQEIGLALGWQKKIVSIKICKDGEMGFLGSKQASQFKNIGSNIEKDVDIDYGYLATAAKIFKHILIKNEYNLRKYKGPVINSLLYALSESHSYKTSMIICEFIIEADKTVPLLIEQLQEIKKIMKANTQVKNSDFAIKVLNNFLSSKTII